MSEKRELLSQYLNAHSKKLIFDNSTIERLFNLVIHEQSPFYKHLTNAHIITILKVIPQAVKNHKHGGATNLKFKDDIFINLAKHPELFNFGERG